MEGPRNPPEVAPEVPGIVPEPPGSRWLTAPDAATLIGHSERGTRDWLDRYDIPFRDGRPRRWSEAAILDRLAALGEPPRKIPEAAPEGSGISSEPIEARFRLTGEPATALVPFERVTELTAGLVERISELTVRSEALALEVGQLRERTAGHEGRLAAKDETIAELRRQRDEDREREREALAELRRRAEVAEAELDVVRLRLVEVDVPPVVVVAGQDAAEAPHTTATTPEAHKGIQGLWWCLRRAWWRG